MVSAPAHSEAGGLPAAPTGSQPDDRLVQMACRLPSLSFALPRFHSSAVDTAAQRLVSIVAQLRSPTSGWPEDLPQTPENLAPYASEEAAELLAALQNSSEWPSSQPSSQEADQLVMMAQLLPQLLWAIASSSYETMRLLEGVKVRHFHSSEQFELRVVRLVPLLVFAGQAPPLRLDIVTQSTPEPQDWLPETTQMQLVEADLDSPRLSVPDWLHQIRDRLTPVALQQLLPGLPVEAMLPGQPWQHGQLRLELQLADMGCIEPDSETSEADERFTLEDFASSLQPQSPQALSLLSPETAAPNPDPDIATTWLTFTDEAWIQGFLLRSAHRDLQLLLAPASRPESELPLVQAAFEAVSRVQGPQGWLKHTFVNHSLLVADLWPRLRWYVTGSSDGVMERMTGQVVRYLVPGHTWQLGRCYLQVLITLTRPEAQWVIDLATGQPLSAPPPAVSPDTVLAAASGLQMMADLQADTAVRLQPAMDLLGALWQGTAIELQSLEGETGPIPAQLGLDWQFTIWPEAQPTPSG